MARLCWDVLLLRGRRFCFFLWRCGEYVVDFRARHAGVRGRVSARGTTAKLDDDDSDDNDDNDDHAVSVPLLVPLHH